MDIVGLVTKIPTFDPRGPLPKGPQGLSPDEIAESQRMRLMAAITYQVADLGWSNVSIADVVSEAKVSRTAFYENFTDKEACLIAAYDVFAIRLTESVSEVFNPELPWVALITDAFSVYIETLQNDIAATRAFFVEMEAAGPEARARRRDGSIGFASMLKAQHSIALNQDPDLKPISDQVFNGMVFGIRELIRVELDEAEVPDLVGMTGDIITWIKAVIRGMD